MNRIFLLAGAVFAMFPLTAQVEVDKSIELTGTGSDARIQGIKEVSAAEDAVSARVLQTGALIYAVATGSVNSFLVNLSPDPLPLTPGTIVHFVANNAVTGASTLNVNGNGAIPIKKNFDEDLVADEVKAGQAVSVIYDGNNFQVISQLAPASSGGGGFSFSDTKRIFVTSTTYNGNLGGISGADSRCQTRASAAGLTGSWKALISTGSVHARNRSNHQKLIVNMLGEPVAFGYKDLFMSLANLDNNITVIENTVAYNEFGAAITSVGWWNGSDESGRGGWSSCDDWTNGSGSAGGHIGETSRIISGSFYGGNGNNQNCNNLARLICFEE